MARQVIRLVVKTALLIFCIRLATARQKRQQAVSRDDPLAKSCRPSLGSRNSYRVLPRLEVEPTHARIKTASFPVASRLLRPARQ